MSEHIRGKIADGRTSLGIELGSTRIKAVLMDDSFETIASGNFEWENRLENGFWTYHLTDIIHGLQTAYGELRQEVEQRYGTPLQSIGAIGISGMMHGYMAFDETGELLVPFRTWRNVTTSEAAKALTADFQFNIPDRWSIAHLYQAVLDEEAHLHRIHSITTLSGFIHYLLTGQKAVGIGDASGMFPIDDATKDYDESMVEKFDRLVQAKGFAWKLKDILPEVHLSGEKAGELTEVGVKILDRSNTLQPGVPLCPPEGDAGTGMVATDSVRKRTGNVSVGTSVFAMIVLEKKLSKVYPEIDMVTTPNGHPVAMVHANNCSSDLNAWIGLFREFCEATGQQIETDELFRVMLNKALEADADGGGLISYGYLSGESITGLESGRPLFARSPDSNFNLPNFMRTHLFTAFGALKIGMDTLTKEERIEVQSLLAHGGLFRTPVVGQKIVAGAMNIPVSVMDTAGEGGAWGMAVLAAYMKDRAAEQSLDDFLDNQVFSGVEVQEMNPDPFDVEGFDQFIQRYKQGLEIEAKAVENLM